MHDSLCLIKCNFKATAMYEPSKINIHVSTFDRQRRIFNCKCSCGENIK